VRGAGASGVQVIRHAALPEAANEMLSQMLFMFEYNVRASAVLGFVGAGGVGFFMMQYLQTFQYGRLAGVILLTVAAVLLIDGLSARIRSAFLLDRKGRG
jgi:phosphonate transport system permease protein